jgi:hypothetical protein
MSTYTARSHGRHIRRRTTVWIWPAALAVLAISLLVLSLTLLGMGGLDVLAAFVPISGLVLGGVAYGAMITVTHDRLTRES